LDPATAKVLRPGSKASWARSARPSSSLCRYAPGQIRPDRVRIGML